MLLLNARILTIEKKIENAIRDKDSIKNTFMKNDLIAMLIAC